MLNLLKLSKLLLKFVALLTIPWTIKKPLHYCCVYCVLIFILYRVCYWCFMCVWIYKWLHVDMIRWLEGAVMLLVLSAVYYVMVAWKSSAVVINVDILGYLLSCCQCVAWRWHISSLNKSPWTNEYLKINYVNGTNK